MTGIVAPAAGPASESGAPNTDASSVEGAAAAANAAATASAPLNIDAEPESPVASVVYDSTGNVGLDLALEFIGGLGVGPDDPAMKAAEGGDFSALEALLRGMGVKAKGYERMLALGKSAFESFDKDQKTKAAATETAIHAVVGGPERWAEIQSWAKANAEPDERASVNTALAAGGMAAKAMAHYLAHRFSVAAGTSYEPASQVADANATGGRAATGGGPLSPAEYVKAVNVLRVELKGKIEGSSQYATLQSRRRAYRG